MLVTFEKLKSLIETYVAPEAQKDSWEKQCKLLFEVISEYPTGPWKKDVDDAPIGEELLYKKDGIILMAIRMTRGWSRNGCELPTPDAFAVFNRGERHAD